MPLSRRRDGLRCRALVATAPTIACLLAVLLAGPARAESPQAPAEVLGSPLLPDLTALVQTAGPSTAFVLATDEYGQVLQGSGVVVRADGWIATSYELVAWTDTFEVQIEREDRLDAYPAVLVRTFPDINLALLQIPNHHLTALATAPDSAVRAGTRVIGLGYPAYNQLERGLRLSRGSLASPPLAQGRPSRPVLLADMLYVTGLAGSAVCTPDGALLGIVIGPDDGSMTRVRVLPAAEVLSLVEAVASTRVSPLWPAQE